LHLYCKIWARPIKGLIAENICYYSHVDTVYNITVHTQLYAEK
jgi:hypothetical protein